MKKTALSISLLLSVGSEIKAEPAIYVSNRNTFQPLSGFQKLTNWDDEIQTIDLYNSNIGNMFSKEKPISIKLHASKLDSSITKSNHTQQQIIMKNATILHTANEFVKKGNYESFLSYCTEDTKWVFVGERVLNSRDEVREYMKEFYLEPPVFTVEKTIEDGNYVTVTGEITLKASNGTYHHYDYCDIWRFENGKIAELKAFVIEKNPEK